MENIFFLALLAVVGLIRWLSQVAENRKNKEAERRAHDPAPNTPIPRAPVDSEEERIRKFMEALGVPTSTARPEAPPREAPPAPPRKPPLMPVDPFPKPHPFFPRPPASAPQSAPAPQLVPSTPTAVPTVTAAPPPLPTRETKVLTEPARRMPAVRRAVSERDAYAIDQEAGYEDRALADATEPLLAPTSLAARLATQQGLRDAIILREIFGPPRSMQPFEPGRVS